MNAARVGISQRARGKPDAFHAVRVAIIAPM
jgi:hypothetical protein